MKHSLLLWLALWAVGTQAQEFGARWISHPMPDSVSQIWFRKTFVSKERPLMAQLTVTSTGCLDVYVNECNVSNTLISLNRHAPSDVPITRTFDISHLLRSDSNTIALWYAPSYPHIEHHQVAVVYSGKDRQGRNFAHLSDESWLCRPANRTLDFCGSEAQDGYTDSAPWNATSVHIALWQGAKKGRGHTEYGKIPRDAPAGQERAIRIRTPKYFDLVGDSIYYEFGEPFYGFLRATLRDCKKGEVIHFGNFEYICNGKTDEQAFPKFARFFGKRILVYGDKWFKREQIQRLEIVEVTIVNDSETNY
ncbi:alpha-L-rhamnosidase [Prevotella sp. oral taxon 376]|uniref:alpha-L-rhamnosidase n=1 Tax=Prevotella sp. oral taxon 376 TaxID=712466 RepID=UPI0011B217C9|nr:alpha-L-rhamnosidase [Prevotella sp. oral taxon 376]